MSIKKNLFRTVLFLIPFLVLLLLEMILRLSGYGYDLSITAEVMRNGKNYYTLNQLVGKRYFNEDRMYFRKGSHDFFEVEKQPNTIRVFCFGASTTAGFPYEYNAIPSEFLRDRLLDALPGKNIEVINTAIAATNSFTVSELVNEMTAYKPDLYIIYMGQNEFYGAFGTGSAISVGKNRSIIKTYLWLQQFKTFQLLKDGIASIRNLFGTPEDGENKLLMEQMAANNSIKYGSDEYNTALSSFRENYEEIMESARENNIPLIISSLVTNEKDLPPFVSFYSDDLSKADEAKRRQLTNLGNAALNDSDYNGALKHFRDAISINPSAAIIHYKLGKCYEGLKNYEEAAKEYTKAKDLDGLRFRAPSEFNNVIRDLSVRYNIPLTDAEKIFRENSPNGITGNELLIDHLHPRISGYFLLAKSWFQTIKEKNIFNLGSFNMPYDSILWQHSTVTDLDSSIGEIKIAKLKSGLPFTHVKKEFEITTYNFIEDIAFDYSMLNKMSWGEAHLNAAKEYIGRSDFEKALREYRAISVVDENNPFILKLTGDMYYQLNAFSKAEELYLQALSLSNNRQINYKLGLTNIALKKPAIAVQYLQQCLISGDAEGFNPKEIEEIHYNLGLAYQQLGQHADAERQIQTLLKINPQSTRARELQRGSSR